MKKILLTLLVIFGISRLTHAQWVNGTNLMYYTSGNIGIGTATPVAGLSVEAGPNAAMSPLTSVPNGSAWIGAANTTGGISIGQFSGTYGYIQSRNKGTGSGAYKLALNPLGGFVGVGTTAPASALHVKDANATLLTLERNAGATNMNIQYKNSVNSIFAGLDANGGFSIGTTANFSNSSLLTATADGNVGVGTFTPNAKLEVRGTILSSGTNSNLDVTDPVRGNISYLANSGQMVIGWNRNAGAGETDFISNQGLGGQGGFAFYNYDNSGVEKQLMWVQGNGNVGIGTNDPKGYKLAVNGGVIATAVTVKVNSAWPDYVFKKDYQLPSLTDVKTYIDQNQHLPEVPSEEQIAKEGLNLGEMNKLLMKKVEELTLYLIEIKQEVKELQKQNESLKKSK